MTEDNFTFKIDNNIIAGYCRIESKEGEIAYEGSLANAPNLVQGNIYFMCESDYRLMHVLVEGAFDA